MKILLILISALCFTTVKAQYPFIKTVEPFEKYYDTVRVIMVVSDSEPYSTLHTLIGYEVYVNEYEAAGWGEWDNYHSAQHNRSLVLTMYDDKKRKINNELIIWQRKQF